MNDSVEPLHEVGWFASGLRYTSGERIRDGVGPRVSTKAPDSRSIDSHPFAKCAKEWGSLVSYVLARSTSYIVG